MGVAYDSRHDTIVVANNGDDSILIYGRASNGDVAPVRVIRGDRTGMNRPIGVAVDAAERRNLGIQLGRSFRSGL